MFNSPVLDVAIGLIFIFLLYSLLATSIKEAIATALALRAKMLKKGIVEGMLSKTPLYGRAKSILVFIQKNILDFLSIIGLTEKKDGNKIGDKFYKHPLIKNYGSNRVYPLPSYLPTINFSTVLIDVLKEDFNDKLDDIATNKRAITNSTDDLSVIKKNLFFSNDATKIKELLEYYGSHYLSGKTGEPPNSAIDCDTWSILQMHLRNSVYDINVFAKKLENWFDDSMDRVSGWYKRQVQVILFILGFILAIIFNVDTIQIANRLTTDKDARDKIVQLAIKASDQYKDDPRVKKVIKNGDTIVDPTDTLLFQQYQNKLTTVQNDLKGNVSNANDLLSLGWGDYGKSRDSVCISEEKYKEEFDTFFLSSLKNIEVTKNVVASKTGKPDTSLLNKKDTTKTHQIPITVKTNYADTIKARDSALYKLYDKHWIKLKVGYVLDESRKGKKFLGFIILAFAVCLGAPFWFDLLNKFINLRGSGQKEVSNTANVKADSTADSKQQPVTINVNNQNPEEEAVG